MGQPTHGSPEGAVWAGLIGIDHERGESSQKVEQLRDLEYIKIKLKPTFDYWRGESREYVWQDDAACSGAPLNLFIAESKAVEERRRLEGAIQDYCDGCPVRGTCLETAQESDLFYAVRGGLLPAILDARRPDKPPMFNKDVYELWECAHHGRSDVGFTTKRRGKRGDGEEYQVEYCRICAQEGKKRWRANQG